MGRRAPQGHVHLYIFYFSKLLLQGTWNLDKHVLIDDLLLSDISKSFPEGTVSGPQSVAGRKGDIKSQLSRISSSATSGLEKSPTSTSVLLQQEY